jgi:hypothetical protein
MAEAEPACSCVDTLILPYCPKDVRSLTQEDLDADDLLSEKLRQLLCLGPGPYETAISWMRWELEEVGRMREEMEEIAHLRKMEAAQTDEDLIMIFLGALSIFHGATTDEASQTSASKSVDEALDALRERMKRLRAVAVAAKKARRIIESEEDIIDSLRAGYDEENASLRFSRFHEALADLRAHDMNPIGSVKPA